MAVSLDHAVVNSFLRGPRYPISKGGLVHLAEINRVPGELIDALRTLPPGDYSSEEEVMDHLRQQGHNIT